VGHFAQCTWSVALTTVDDIFQRKNGRTSFWGHICATIYVEVEPDLEQDDVSEWLVNVMSL